MAEDKPQQAAGDDYTCIKDNKEKASGNLLHSDLTHGQSGTDRRG